MDSYSEIASDDNTNRPGGRLIVTHEGLLDQALLRRTEGYMYKKGGAVNARGGFRNWKKRWFVIAPVEILGAQGYELQYYDGPNGTLKGKVGLSEIEIHCDAKSTHKNVKHEFQISLQNGGLFELSCDDETERDEWIETLNMITAYLRKVLTNSSMTLDGYDPHDEDNEQNHQIGHDIALNCQAFGPGLFGAEAGTQSQFVVQVHDLVGQQVTRGGMPLTATLSSPQCIYYLRVIDNDDGTYFCQYMLGRAGRYQLHIRLNDEHDIFGSPFDVEILPSRTVARYCTAHGEALTSMTANQQHSFTIQAMDGFGNRKNKGGDPFEVGVMGPAQLRALTDNSDGTYTCTVATQAPSAAGYVTSSSLLVQVALHGRPIAGSPFKPVIVEDLRGLYGAGAAGGGASVVSAGSSYSPSAASNRYAQQQGGSYYAKHAMAQQQYPQASSGASVMSHSTRGGSAPPAPPGGSTAGGGGREDLLNELDQDAESSNASPGRSPLSPTNAPSPGGGSVASRGRGAPPPPPPAAGGGSVVSAGGASRASGAAVRGAPQAAQSPAPAPAPAPPAPTMAAGSPPPRTTGTPAAVTPSAAGGAGLSRLERSRQRALLAKALTESAASPLPAPAPVPEASTAVTGGGTGGYTGEAPGHRLSKLEELQRNLAASSVGGTGHGQGSGSAQQQAQRSLSGAQLQSPQVSYRPCGPVALTYYEFPYICITAADGRGPAGEQRVCVLHRHEPARRAGRQRLLGGGGGRRAGLSGQRHAE
jgi:hypothetical protein